MGRMLVWSCRAFSAASCRFILLSLSRSLRDNGKFNEFGVSVLISVLTRLFFERKGRERNEKKTRSSLDARDLALIHGMYPSVLLPQVSIAGRSKRRRCTYSIDNNRTNRKPVYLFVKMAVSEYSAVGTVHAVPMQIYGNNNSVVVLNIKE